MYRIINGISLWLESFTSCPELSFIFSYIQTHTHTGFTPRSLGLPLEVRVRWRDEVMRSKRERNQEGLTLGTSLIFKGLLDHFSFPSFFISVLTEKKHSDRTLLLFTFCALHQPSPWQQVEWWLLCNPCHVAVCPRLHLVGVNRRLWPQSEVTARSEDAESSNIKMVGFVLFYFYLCLLRANYNILSSWASKSNTQLNNAHFEKQPWQVRSSCIKIWFNVLFKKYMTFCPAQILFSTYTFIRYTLYI